MEIKVITQVFERAKKFYIKIFLSNNKNIIIVRGCIMSQINDLLNKIEELYDKIDEEKINNSKRKIQIDYKIKELEKEKKHAGLKNDFASVDKYISQIARLREEKNFNHIEQYNKDIKAFKKELVYIILDYYQKGIYIQDIIKLENISQNITSKWLNISDFGNNTGFLFVMDKGNQSPCWYYANPITDIKVSSNNLNDLQIKIKEKNEELTIFNEDLANKSYAKDIKYSQIEINNKLEILKYDQYTNHSEIFTYFKNNYYKFNKKQLVNLCELMIKNPFLNKYGKDFNYIIDNNKYKLNSNFIKDTYKQIINQILLQFLTNEVMKDIFIELSCYVEKFTENDAKKLFSLIIKNEANFYQSDLTDDFIYITKYIDEKFINIDLNHLYAIIIISVGLKKLKLITFGYSKAKKLLDILVDNANFFTISQINRFCQISLTNSQVYNCYKCRDSVIYILNANKSKISEDLYNEVLNKISRTYY